MAERRELPRRAASGAKGGFTLIELLVVVLILGILAGVGLPQYLKTVEVTKADDAQAQVNMIAQANRMYNANNEAWVASVMDNNSVLVTSKYLPASNWDYKPYLYYTCNPDTGAGGGCCGATYVACCVRGAGASANYAGWAYAVDNKGTVYTSGGAPSPSAN